MRHFHQCSFCGERFVIEGRASGSEHACAQLVAQIARDQQATEADYRFRLRVGIGGFTAEQLDAQLPEILAARAGETLRIYAPSKPLQFKPKAKTDKCGPKCWGAKKNDCSCECGGHNHGLGKAPSAN